MIQKADNQDLEFIVSPLTVDDKPINPINTSWRLELWAYSNRKLIVEAENGIYKSIGVILANCIASDRDIRVYAKGSETPFGRGNIRACFTLFANNQNFPAGKQVIKTLEINTKIQIV
ncbi:MAG: hypothetical protein RR015_01830 [Bacteroidales bacterium]